MTSSLTPSERHSIDADLRRRTEEFLATNPNLSKKLDELDKLLMGNYLQAQLQRERNGWRSSLSKAMEELERHRKLSMQTTASDAEDVYKLQRKFTDFVDEEEEEEEEKDAQPEVKSDLAEEDQPEAAKSAEIVHLREQLTEALDKASAASELAWHYENFIRELKSINAKLESRLTQLTQERRRCARVLAASSAHVDEGQQGATATFDLYKAIRELQNRCEQLAREQQEQRQQQPQQKQQSQPNRTYCSACGSAMNSSTPMSDSNELQTPRDSVAAGTNLGWKRGVRAFAASKAAADIAIVPLRPKHPQQLQQQQQQQSPASHLTDDASQTDQHPDLLAESLAENARLRRDLHTLAKALRTAEEDAKEKASQMAAYEKQVASMKHAFTYRQPVPATQAPEGTNQTTTISPPDGPLAPAAVNNSLPILNLARNTQKRSRRPQQQQQQQQQQVMPAKTSVTRCLRCQKLYRLVDNNKFACKYHSKGRQRVEQHSTQGRLADVLFVWDCCGRLANAEGCCYSEHI